jgi:hypothetical protein
VELLVESENPGKTFTLEMTGQAQKKTYKYDENDTVTRVPLLLPGGERYEVLVRDSEMPDCLAVTSFETPECGCTMRLTTEILELGLQNGKIRLTVHTNDPVSDQFRIMYQTGGNTTELPGAFNFTPPKTDVEITLPNVQEVILITVVDIQSKLCRASTEFRWVFPDVD